MTGLLTVWLVAATIALAVLIKVVNFQGREIRRMAILIDDLIAKVTALKTVDESLIALVQGLKAQLDAAIAALPDQTKLQALSDGLDQLTTEVTDAVTANTPPVPPVVP